MFVRLVSQKFYQTKTQEPWGASHSDLSASRMDVWNAIRKWCERYKRIGSIQVYEIDWDSSSNPGNNKVIPKTLKLEELFKAFI